MAGKFQFRMSGRFSFIIVPVIALTFVSGNQPIMNRLNADEPNAVSPRDSVSFEAAWPTIHDVVETVLRNHISPPTRQEMYLNAARGMFNRSDALPPRELVEEFSALDSDDEFKSALEEIWNHRLEMLSESGTGTVSEEQVQQLTIVVIANLLSRVPGGAVFTNARNSRVNQQLSENQYVGIGIQLSMQEGYPMINKPFIGGAAHTAGSQAGDLITEIEGQPTKGIELGVIVEQLRGPEGAPVTVSLRHKDGTELKNVRMVRAVIPIPSIHSVHQNEDGSWDVMQPGTTTAVLHFKDLVGSTAAELRTFIAQIRAESATAVVLDFSALTHRDNGFPEKTTDVHHALMLGDVLLKDSTLGHLVEEDSRLELKTGPEALLTDIPVYIIAGGKADAPLYPVLRNLSRQDNVTMVGSAVYTDFVCHASFPLSNPDLGTLEHIPYAMLMPEDVAEEASNMQIHEQAVPPNMLGFPADKQTSGKVADIVKELTREGS